MGGGGWYGGAGAGCPAAGPAKPQTSWDAWRSRTVERSQKAGVDLQMTHVTCPSSREHCRAASRVPVTVPAAAMR
eukprot:7097469-Prymnesium_polylepis.1